MDEKNERSVLCYRNALGYCQVGNCDLHHVVGSEYPKDFVIKLYAVIGPGVKKILEKGKLPGETGKKCTHSGGDGRR